MEWITALAAVKRLGGDFNLLRTSIPLRLQNGAIRSRADHFFINGVRQGHEGKPFAIEPEFWKLFNLEGTWRTGDFKGGGNPLAADPATYEAVGIKLYAADLDKMAIVAAPSPEGSPVSSSVPTDPGGAPVRAENWENLVAVMAAFTVAKDIKPDLKPGELYKQLMDYADRIGVTIPSRTTAIGSMKKAIQFTSAPHDSGGNPLRSADGKSLD